MSIRVGAIPPSSLLTCAYSSVVEIEPVEWAITVETTKGSAAQKYGKLSLFTHRGDSEGPDVI